jgi:hypothetical protein
MRRLKITGVNLRHRPIPEKGRLIEAVESTPTPSTALAFRFDCGSLRT